MLFCYIVSVIVYATSETVSRRLNLLRESIACCMQNMKTKFMQLHHRTTKANGRGRKHFISQQSVVQFFSRTPLTSAWRLEFHYVNKIKSMRRFVRSLECY